MNFLKRTIPLMITAGVGFVLIIASFIPATVDWGETATVWFDILAGVAFILGGGNLLKVQLKKISDQSAGWGYALVTLLAFMVTLIVGLFKFGTPPVDNQEFYGQVFVELPLDDLPESQTFRVPGTIPKRKVDPELPASVRQQLSEEDGQLVFRGWISNNQVEDLKGYNTTLAWHCTVEQLAKTAQPSKLLGSISYLSDHQSLGFEGQMTQPEQARLETLGDGEVWTSAVEKLAELSRRNIEVKLPSDFEWPETFREPPQANADQERNTLAYVGPMSTDQRDELLNQYPVAVPLSSTQRDALQSEIESKGEKLTKEQAEAFQKMLDAQWSIDQLVDVILAAGIEKPTPPTACELLEQRGKAPPTVAPKPDRKLTRDQIESLREPLPNLAVKRLADDIGRRIDATTGNEQEQLTSGQKSAITKFLESQPTIGERNQAIYFALLKSGPVSPDQKAFLLADIKAEAVWQHSVVQLFQQAHQVKYPWSGNYLDQGTPFWWVYEYLFKPLTATMFSLLAFYVASAAFRAFRAKNLEAGLLLGTAFIILLGRTFAGVLLTGWIPDALAGLRIENLAVYIMQVFNTAGNRAIMIGIALGIASTSLKVLLGIDRSYLGSRED